MAFLLIISLKSCFLTSNRVVFTGAQPLELQIFLNSGKEDKMFAYRYTGFHVVSKSQFSEHFVSFLTKQCQAVEVLIRTSVAVLATKFLSIAWLMYKCIFRSLSRWG